MSIRFDNIYVPACYPLSPLVSSPVLFPPSSPREKYQRVLQLRSFHGGPETTAAASPSSNPSATGGAFTIPHSLGSIGGGGSRGGGGGGGGAMGEKEQRTTIDDFEIIKPISKGAYGRVFLAQKRTTGDLFAIKVLRKADMIRKNAVESVQAERNILASARSPFVVRCFYSFTCRENLYMVMEYLDGGDLFSLLHACEALEESAACFYTAELVQALEYLHSLGVVHRDIKPDNLLIAHDGHIKLTDFGLSRVGLINSAGDLSTNQNPPIPSHHASAPSSPGKHLPWNSPLPALDPLPLSPAPTPIRRLAIPPPCMLPDMPPHCMHLGALPLCILRGWEEGAEEEGEGGRFVPRLRTLQGEGVGEEEEAEEEEGEEEEAEGEGEGGCTVRAGEGSEGIGSTGSGNGWGNSNGNGSAESDERKVGVDCVDNQGAGLKNHGEENAEEYGEGNGEEKAKSEPTPTAPAAAMSNATDPTAAIAGAGAATAAADAATGGSGVGESRGEGAEGGGRVAVEAVGVAVGGGGGGRGTEGGESRGAGAEGGGRVAVEAVGTPDYLAPEILLGLPHGPAADWWSVGVLLYELLVGIPPFNAPSPQQIFDNILNRDITWPAVPEDMSYEAKDLIDRLLTFDPDERLGAQGAHE
ncbi:unnamed protein product, partial [Closterium sp. NIES-53]